MKLLEQIRVAVVGMPDSGKSTFIQHVVQAVTGRYISPDTLMREVHWSDGKDPYGNPDTRTIKCAKITFKYGGYEIMMYDCPGHIEYLSQIKQGLRDAQCIIRIVDSKRKNESQEYLNNPVFEIEKPGLLLCSHSDDCNTFAYDVENTDAFKDTAIMVCNWVVGLVMNHIIIPIDVISEAKELITMFLPAFSNKGMMFSGGKDSWVGLQLLKEAEFLDEVKVYFPSSGDDFDEVLDSVRAAEKYYGIHIKPFSNNGGLNINQVSNYDWLQQKAVANNELVEKDKIRLLMVQYRSSDEGVRSKDYHIVDKWNHFRFSPVFYFSESNIWRFIDDRQLPFCKLYLKGYRSLGDKHLTEPCMPKMHSLEELVNYIDKNTQTSERDGRTKQDGSQKFAMERLRDGGFF